MPRPNIPFEGLDFEEGFEVMEGRGAGIAQKVLSSDWDPEAKAGKRTRLLRLDAGVQTPDAHAHDFWEEIYIISGSIIEGTPETGERRITGPAYAAREPGFMHGPVRTDEPCLMIEFSWYEDK